MSCSNVLVSIVIPAFNAQDFIAETLDSLIGQSYPHTEIIVIDDGSTDRTAEIVHSYCKKKNIHYKYQSNSGGCSSPRNHGLRIAKGQFICFFDSDDVMEPNRISRQVEFLNKTPSAAQVVFDYINFNRKGLFFQSHFRSCHKLMGLMHGKSILQKSSDACFLLLEENYNIASASLYHTNLVKAVGGFDEALFSCEDFHLNYRMALAGSVLVVDEIGFRRRLHTGNMSANTPKMLRNYIKSRSDLLDKEKDLRRKITLQKSILKYHLGLADHLAQSGMFESIIMNLKALKYIKFFEMNDIVKSLKNLAKFILVFLKLRQKSVIAK
ncbi:MAG: glycosyltransferase involved in cell wall biosynthesis [Desulforhopalus sp.]|jgi:glycosyltransferase involved in cell wall biosynthesis